MKERESFLGHHVYCNALFFYQRMLIKIAENLSVYAFSPGNTKHMLAPNMRPKFETDAYYIPELDGVYLRGNNYYLVLEGKSIYPLNDPALAQVLPFIVRVLLGRAESKKGE